MTGEITQTCAREKHILFFNLTHLCAQPQNQKRDGLRPGIFANALARAQADALFLFCVYIEM